MYRVSVDFTKCKACMKCEILFPGFRYIHGGQLQVSRRNICDEEKRASAYRIKRGCPEGAIKLVTLHAKEIT